MKTQELRPAESELAGQKLHVVDIEQAPFEITGFGWRATEGQFCRLPAHLLADPA